MCAGRLPAPGSWARLGLCHLLPAPRHPGLEVAVPRTPALRPVDVIGRGPCAPGTRPFSALLYRWGWREASRDVLNLGLWDMPLVVLTARPVALQLFQKHVDTYGMGYDPIEFICGPFYSIRLLARRFALTLGFDRARDAAHLIHRYLLVRGAVPTPDAPQPWSDPA